MWRPGSNECLQDKPRNRHFAEWRFPRLFTIMVTVKAPICNVIRISFTSFSEVSAEPPTVYRIVSPAHTGEIIVTQKAEFVKFRALTNPCHRL